MPKHPGKTRKSIPTAGDRFRAAQRKKKRQNQSPSIGSKKDRAAFSRGASKSGTLIGPKVKSRIKKLLGLK